MVPTRRNSVKGKKFYNYYYMNYIQPNIRTVKNILLFLLVLCLSMICFVYLSGTKEDEKNWILDLKHDEFREELRAIAERFEQRRQHLTKTCHKLGLDVTASTVKDPLYRPNPYEFLINYEHKLVWCAIYKAGASSWMHNFNLLAGYSPDYLEHAVEIPMKLARKKYRHPTLQELHDAIEDSVSFLIVRHPFERILSAYRDRIMNAIPGSEFAKLGLRMIRMYRPEANKNYDMNNPKYPTFPEFVKYLIYVHQHKLYLNIHWIPVVMFCSPCLIHFDLILKFETLQEDQSFLIQQTGIGDIVKPIKLNAGKGDTKDLIEGYFSQLNREQIESLYEMYKYDFQIFNYTIEKYLTIAKP